MSKFKIMVFFIFTAGLLPLCNIYAMQKKEKLRGFEIEQVIQEERQPIEPREEDEREIELISKDKEKFKIKRKIVEQYSGLIQDMLEGQKEEKGEIPRIPLPEVSSESLMLIHDLMNVAYQMKKINPNESIIKNKLADMIKKKQWSREKIRALFKSLDYLNAVPIFLRALIYYLVTIDEKPNKYITEENPLHLSAGASILYKRYILEEIADYMRQQDFDEPHIKYGLAKIIANWVKDRWKLSHEILEDWLKLPIISGALAFYLINKNPCRFLEYENPLQLSEKQKAIYQKVMSESVDDFIRIKSKRLNFDSWYDKAKKIPLFTKKIVAILRKGKSIAQAGIIPYYYDKKGNVFFLLVKDRNGKCSSFKGEPGKKDKTVEDVAARIGHKKTDGFFFLFRDRVSSKNSYRFLKDKFYPPCMSATPRTGTTTYFIDVTNEVNKAGGREEVIRKMQKWRSLKGKKKIDFVWVPGERFVNDVIFEYQALKGLTVYSGNLAPYLIGILGGPNNCNNIQLIYGRIKRRASRRAKRNELRRR